MKHVRPKHLALGVVAVLGAVLLGRPIAVQYHRLAMRSWHPQNNWEAWSGHQQSLVALGYFEARDFSLKRRVLTNNSNLMHLVDAAPFRDGQWTVSLHSNRVTIIAYRGDMELWNEIVERFDRAEPDDAGNSRTGVR